MNRSPGLWHLAYARHMPSSVLAYASNMPALVAHMPQICQEYASLGTEAGGPLQNMPGICQRGGEAVSGTGLPIWHMPGIFSPHLQKWLSPEPELNLGKLISRAKNRHMPGICPKWGQTAPNSTTLAFLWHFCGIFGQFVCHWHMPGISVVFCPFLALFGPFWPFLAYAWHICGALRVVR